MIEIDLDDFQIPESLYDARDRLVVLAAEIESINIQLDAPDKKGASHYRWRVRAKEARRIKRAEVQWLQNWISKYNDDSALAPEDLKAGGLLLASLPILNSAAEEGLIDEGNQVIVEAVRGYVKNRFPSVGGLVTGTIALEEISA